MTLLFLILIILTCAIITFFVLIQNPKGGGLSGEFGGMGTQLMGAKQSTDVVEKGTWVSAGVLLVLVLASFVLSDKPSTAQTKSRSEEVSKGTKNVTPASAPVAPAAAPSTQPATSAETPATPAPTDSTK
jgi:preprotein translocase subunit SecG